MEALQESEERYRRCFTTSLDCVFITTEEGKWIDFIDTAVKFFGYTSKDEQKEIIIKDLFQNPQDRVLHLAYIIEKEYAKEYPVNLQIKEGTAIHALIITVPIRWMGDTIIEFLGTIRDVTERKKSKKHSRRRTGNTTSSIASPAFLVTLIRNMRMVFFLDTCKSHRLP